MRVTVLREAPLLIGILALIGLETTNLLDWLLLQPALPVLMGLGLSLLATLYPSWRAAKTDPVVALRNE